MKARFKVADSILFEDQDYVIVNKPPFISTLEDRNDPVNVLKLVREVYADPQVCHRLDKDTSGALAIAKNPEAYRHLSMQFENREVVKIYHAVADGIHNFEAVEVDAPILKQNDGTVRISRDGKPAQTTFDTLEKYRHHTLVQCSPRTGRMHQIRIHLAKLGAPITGDEVYGGKPFFVSSVKKGFNLKKESEETPLIKRMALHAFSLKFALLDGKSVEVNAPHPKDFQALLRQLRSNAR